VHRPRQVDWATAIRQRSGAVAQWRSGAVAQWRSGAVAQWLERRTFD